MITSFDHEHPVKVQTLYEVSDILQSLAYFNVDKQDFYADFINKLSEYIGSREELPTTERGQMIKLKFVIIRFLRYQSLFPLPEGVELANKAISMVLKQLKKEIDITSEDCC